MIFSNTHCFAVLNFLSLTDHFTDCVASCPSCCAANEWIAWATGCWRRLTCRACPSSTTWTGASCGTTWCPLPSASFCSHHSNASALTSSWPLPTWLASTRPQSLSFLPWRGRTAAKGTRGCCTLRNGAAVVTVGESSNAC